MPQSPCGWLRWGGSKVVDRFPWRAGEPRDAVATKERLRHTRTVSPCSTGCSPSYPSEHRVFDGLRTDAWAPHLRLEQERIGFAWAERAIAALSTSHVERKDSGRRVAANSEERWSPTADDAALFLLWEAIATLSPVRLWLRSGIGALRFSAEARRAATRPKLFASPGRSPWSRAPTRGGVCCRVAT